MPVTHTLSELKRRLYARAVAHTEEVAHAANALLEGPPGPEQYPDFIDFFAIEWVDAEGLTEVDRAVADGELPEVCLSWPREVRTALWVVDGWEGDQVLLRDARTEAEIAVTAPGRQEDLPRRSVVRARVIPWEGSLQFSGEPDVWEPMGVLARMELVQAWESGPEPDLVARLAALRAAFVRQREEREAWIAWFGADEVVFDDAAHLERALAPFVSHLNNTWRFPSLGGRTRSEAFREAKGAEPVVVQFALGATLTAPGRHGVIFDAVEGVHFLPAWGEVRAHLRGEGHAPELLAAYLSDPGITRLPFRRAGGSVLAMLAGQPGAALEEALDVWKPRIRPTPSVLPGLEEA